LEHVEEEEEDAIALLGVGRRVVVVKIS
jgi:hypothetical protein